MSLLKDIGQLFAGKGESNYQEELLRSLLVMAWMVEARDPYTGGHFGRTTHRQDGQATGCRTGGR